MVAVADDGVVESPNNSAEGNEVRPCRCNYRFHPQGTSSFLRRDLILSKQLDRFALTGVSLAVIALEETLC